MDAKRIYKTANLPKALPEGFEETGLFQCGRCYIWHYDLMNAQKCCICQTCGEPLDPKNGVPYHRHCADLREAQIEQEHIDAAEKLESWDGMVESGNVIYPDLEHLQNEFEHRGEALPEWAFTCPPSPFPKVNFDEIADSIEEQGYEDISATLEGVAEFEAAIAAFNKANAHLVTYWADTRRVVRVREKTDEI